MPFTLAAAVLGLALMSGQVPASAPAEQPSPTLPVSLARIRASLKHQVSGRFAKPLTTADFSVDILEKQRFEDLLTLLGLGGGSPMPTVLFGSAASRPSSAADLSFVGGAVGRAIVEARRKRAERLAREEVARDLVEFCTINECLPRRP